MRALINRLFHPTIRGGITIAFILIIGVVLIYLGTSIYQLRQVQPYSDVILSTSSSMVALQRMTAASAALDADLERYLTLRGPEYQDIINQDLQNMGTGLASLQASKEMQGKAELSDLASTYTLIQGEAQYVLGSDALSSDASTGDINRKIVAAYNDLTKIESLLEALTNATLADSQNAARSQGQIAGTVLNQSLILAVVVMLTAVVSAVMSNRRLGGITTLTQITGEMAAGDLNRVAPEGRRDELGALAVSFNAMTRRVREMVNTLEQRVADRTRAIETSSEISRRLSTILDQKQLALAVVEEVRRAFNFYHAHIYLYDEAEVNLVMVGGTGEAGQLMLGRGHQIPKGRGLVGRCAEQNQVVLVSDTQADPTWLPNPLLPDTKSEVAVPISAGGKVSGVLDVQHNVVNGLSQQDVDLLQSIANQVGVAVQNATLFTQTQRQADRESLVNAIGQKIQTANSVEGVLQVLTRELGAALQAQRVIAQVGGNVSDEYLGKG